MARILVTPTSFRGEQNREAQQLLNRFSRDIIYNMQGKPLQGPEILSLIDGVDGYIAGLDNITAEVVRQMPDTVKVISRYGAGFDRVDINACRERGIAVTNTPGVNTTAVCELAFGLMLAVARQIPMLHQSVVKGEWPRVTGMELAGKTLGIVGLGAIGKKLAVRAKAFEMQVVAFDPYLDKKFALEHDVQCLDLPALLEQTDVISLHVPLSEKTKHMIGAAEIAHMRDGAYLINTARGGLIDEFAVAEALKSGKLGGIGLDTFESEPPIASPLFALDHVVMTPHTGAHTKEAIAAMGMLAVKNLIDVLEGKDCPYQIC